MYYKETITPYVTAGTQLTSRAVITLVTLSFLVLNSPAKLPWDERGGFPTLEVMNSPTLPLAELHTLKAQNIIQRECCKKLALQLKESIVKQSPHGSLGGPYNRNHRAVHRKCTRRDYLSTFFAPTVTHIIVICTVLHLSRLNYSITIIEYD